MQPSHPMKPSIAAIWAFWSFASVLASLSNITVDDTEPAIQYSPLSAWNVGSTCKPCEATPDAAKAYGGTWHDSTHHEGSDQLTFASLEYTGSAIYVFCIIPHASRPFIGTSDMSFFLDGEKVGTFTLAPTGSNVYDYNVPVYTNASVTHGTHNFTLQNGTPNASQSLVLLDYIIYTTLAGQADATSSSLSTTMSQSPSHLSSVHASSQIAAIVVASVIASFFAAGVIFFFCARRKRRRERYYGLSTFQVAQSPETGSESHQRDRAHIPLLILPYDDAPTPISLQHAHAETSAPNEPPFEYYYDTERQSTSAPPKTNLVAVPPSASASRFFGPRPLPTRSASTRLPRAIRAQHSHTSLSTAPPAYDDISRNGEAHS